MDNAHEHNEEEHDVSRYEVLYRHEHDQGHDHDDDSSDVVVEQVAIAVRCPSGGEHDDEPEAVGRARHERGRRSPIPKPSHDRGQREDDAVDGDVDGEVDNAPEPGAPVGEGGADLPAAEGLIGLLCVVGFIGKQHDAFLGWRQEASSFGVCGHENRCDEPEACGYASFDDENPPGLSMSENVSQK